MTPKDAAWRRARRLYRGNYSTAYYRGALAALDGRKTSACPYVSGGWGNAFRRAWLHGHASVA